MTEKHNVADLVIISGNIGVATAWSPTPQLKFFRLLDGHRVLHQLWFDTLSGNSEWRRVEEEALDEQPTNGIQS